MPNRGMPAKPTERGKDVRPPRWRWCGVGRDASGTGSAAARRDAVDALQCLRVRREITTRFIGSENSCALTRAGGRRSVLAAVGDEHLACARRCRTVGLIVRYSEARHNKSQLSVAIVVSRLNADEHVYTWMSSVCVEERSTLTSRKIGPDVAT